MKSSKNILVFSFVMCAAVIGAKSAQAGGFKFGGGSGNGGGSNHSFKANLGSNNSNHNQFKNGSFNNSYHFNKKPYSSCHDDYHYNNHHVHYVKPVRLVYSQCYHPQFRCCYVFPGDNWYSISKRVYGVDFMCKHIASYNGMTMGSPLMPGQMLRLPVINSNGSLAVSSAPMPAAFQAQGIPFGAQGAQLAPQGLPSGFAPQGLPSGLAPQGSPNGLAPQGIAPQGLPAGFSPQGMPNGGVPQGLPSGVNTASGAPQGPGFAPLQNGTPDGQPTASVIPASSIRTITEKPSLPRVATGSTIELDGESLGEEKGIVRLQFSGLTLPVEVIEWSTTSVKVELPKLDMSRPLQATLEVLRADGSLASSSQIELTPAATRLALGK